MRGEFLPSVGSCLIPGFDSLAFLSSITVLIPFQLIPFLLFKLDEVDFSRLQAGTQEWQYQIKLIYYPNITRRFQEVTDPGDNKLQKRNCHKEHYDKTLNIDYQVTLL